MSRLFTHHDRLYLFQSSFFTASTAGPNAAADDEDVSSSTLEPVTTGAVTATNNGEELKANPAPVATTTAKKSKPASGGGFSIYVPHFHKFFGVMCILNMLLYETPLYRNTIRPQLGERKMALLSCLHVILALSSFEFKIGRTRNGMYTIYREMQLHTIVFTLRSWTVIMCDFALGINNTMHRLILVLFWHIMADLVTKFYKTPSGETTIRRAVNGKPGYQYLGYFAQWGIWFFGFSQLVGTFLMVTDTYDAARMSMFVMTPVQISAFLATLVRKGYFSNQVSITCYFLVITPIFFYHHWTLLEVLCLAAAQVLRFNLKISKYPMWIFLCSVAALFQGDLFYVAANQVAPTVNSYLNTTDVAGASSFQITPAMVSVLKIPSTDVVPAWIYTDTWQLGTGLGNACHYLLSLLY